MNILRADHESVGIWVVALSANAPPQNASNISRNYCLLDWGMLSKIAFPSAAVRKILWCSLVLFGPLIKPSTAVDFLWSTARSVQLEGARAG